MAQSIFKVGDTVNLKSGGPKMTINKIITRTTSIIGEATSELEVNEIHVNWFDESKNELKSGKFAEPQLEAAN